MYRSSHRRCSVRKGIISNFEKFTVKRLCQSLFFNKVADLRPATLLKKRLWYTCFPVNFAKFLRTTFLQNASGQLLLSAQSWFESLIVFLKTFQNYEHFNYQNLDKVMMNSGRDLFFQKYIEVSFFLSVSTTRRRLIILFKAQLSPYKISGQ